MLNLKGPGFSPSTKMLDAINSNPYLLLMLEHFKFDKTVQKKTVADIAKENGISENVFLLIMNLYNGNKSDIFTKFSYKDIGTIVFFLENTHNYYLKEKFPELNRLVYIFRKIGKKAEYGLINKFFINYYNEVKEHLNYEEKVFFPYISNLIKGKNRGKYTSTDFIKHHNDIEDKLLDLRNILLNYISNKKLNTIRRKILLHIFELNFDLNIHTYIEEKILVPLVKKLEKESM